MHKFEYFKNKIKIFIKSKILLIRHEISYFQNQPPTVCYKKGILKNFTKIKGKHQDQNLFFNESAGLSLQLY